MVVIEIFLPLKDNTGRAYPPSAFSVIREQVTTKFGGLTEYSRAPAKGVWMDGEKPVVDEIVIFEVMAQELEADWWRTFRETIEGLLNQRQIVIRATQAQGL